MSNLASRKLRKIIHVDMDCFYAAIEIRDRPDLANKPVAVGAPAEQRGVLCTCNYVARRYGVHSAMPTATAYRHCPDLVLLPVNMSKYRAVAKQIQSIFREYTEIVEPLALDEAYLDVSNASHHQGSATLIAEAIREKIWQTEELTASAGVAPNKFLAKIASGWQKPNGLFVIRPADVKSFVDALPVNKLWGVGEVTAKKLYRLNLKTCQDLQKLSLTELTQHFGKLGQHLYGQCRGIDEREVQPKRIRKSLSVETTFAIDKENLEACLNILHELYQKLVIRIQESAPERNIKNLYIKIKFSDFKQKTAELAWTQVDLNCYLKLFRETYLQKAQPIRLLGLGVHFQDEVAALPFLQESLF